ncbi:unnamed protein product [Heligmosomoides polygyrus]|uniref:CPG4 domain-containing protein n=1 Tax=Heligmosomoides polygyrus TaxID=6339 RepID=A0A183FS62_HELPZ|nr:unnamed protein product [Heligmosomoides polygyrus]
MIVWLLLFSTPTVYGASIPTQPVIPTASACLQGCFDAGSVVNAAFDLLNFKSIAVDIENFCSLNSALLKCGRECPSEQIRELEARTQGSSFICGEKVEEFRLVSGCLEGAPDVTLKCATECEVPTDVPLRLDSSAAASVNPIVFLDGVAGTCKKHVCVLKCAQKGFNKECAGAGDLFRDVARHQVGSGIEMLTDASTDENATTIHVMAENYLKNLPSECAFLKDLHEFDEVVESDIGTTSEIVATSTIPSAKVAAEAEGGDVDEATKEAEKAVTVEDEATTTSALVEETSSEALETTIAHGEVSGGDLLSLFTIESFVEQSTKEPILVGGFVMETSDEETTTRAATSPEMPEEELEELGPLVTVPTPVEVTEGDVTPEEGKEQARVEGNAVLETTLTPTEPVIVVDDAPADAGENSIQAGTKEEVKSSASATLVFSTLSAAVTVLLLV